MDAWWVELCSSVRFILNLSFPPGCPESLGIIWERPYHTSSYPLALMFFVPLNCGCNLHRLLPMAPKCNIVEAFRDPSLGSGSEPGGLLSAVSLTSIGSDFLEYLGLIVVTVPRNPYLKCMVFLLSVQDYSPPHKACGYIQSTEFSVPWGKLWFFQK